MDDYRLEPQEHGSMEHHNRMKKTKKVRKSFGKRVDKLNIINYN